MASRDGHPQPQLKSEAAMSSQRLNRKETLGALGDARQGRVVSGWVGCGLDPLLTTIWAAALKLRGPPWFTNDQNAAAFRTEEK